MIVAKFGGTVLNGADGVRQVCAEIRRLPRPLLVVLSAFADMTNQLERLAAAATHDSADATARLHAFLDYHAGIARQVLSDDACGAWAEQVQPLRSRLEEVVRGLAIVRELSPRTLDLVVHFGERFSSSIVLAALNDGQTEGRATGISALDIIITDTTHRYARPDAELTRERVESKLKPALRGDAVVLTEGYIARSTAGEATTMGRESSDFTATLLGELLGADEVRIYTNVPGILTADPTVLPSPRTLPRLSYGMARMLAELGAKVLHARTVTPVERGGIPLVITRLNGDGTTIGSEGGSDACSVVLLPDISILTLHTTTNSASLDGFLRALSTRVPIVWHHRFRRRVEIVTARPVAGGELPLHLIGEEVTATVAAGSLVSLVAERVLCGSDIRHFFATLGNRTPIAIQGGGDGRAMSVALTAEEALEVHALLHSQFVEEGEA